MSVGNNYGAKSGNEIKSCLSANYKTEQSLAQFCKQYDIGELRPCRNQLTDKFTLFWYVSWTQIPKILKKGLHWLIWETFTATQKQ